MVSCRLARVVKGSKNYELAISARAGGLQHVRYSEKILESRESPSRPGPRSYGEDWPLKDDTAKVVGAPSGHSPVRLDKQHSDAGARQNAKLGTVIDTWMRDTEVTSAPSVLDLTRRIFGVVPARS